MNRYFYYLALLFMLINTIIFVPRILIEARFHGAISAILIAIPLGTLLAFLFYRGIKSFRGLALPDILKSYFPAYLRSPSIVCIAIMWFAGGSIVIIGFSQILVNFLNPDIPLASMVLFLVLIGIWTATFSSSAILYALEIILVFALPVQLFIYYKAYQTQSFNWNSILFMSDYAFDLPSWGTLSAATFLFSGYLSLAWFNRLFSWKTPLTHFWMIPAAGILISLNTFFIPISLHGTEAVNQYLDIWINTSDSLRMQYGIIERVLFLYLFLFMGLSLIFISMTWHVGTELIKSVFPTQPPYLKWIIVGGAGAVTLLYAHYSDEKQFYAVVQQWLNLRLALEIIGVALVFLLGRKWRRKHA